MNRKKTVFTYAWTTVLAGLAAAIAIAEESPPTLELMGDWQVRMTVASDATSREQTTTLAVSPPIVVTVKAEKYDRLPLFNLQTAGWAKGAPLHGVAAQECTSYGMLDPASLVVRTGPEDDAPRLELGKNVMADLDWGTIGRLPNGQLGKNEPAYVDYQYVAMRIDSIVLTRQGQVELRQCDRHEALCR